MDFITVPFTFGIGAYAFYKLMELFIRKKERIMIIEKLSALEGVSSEKLDFSKLFSNSKSDKGQYLALRFGSLIVGLGFGLLVGYFLGMFAFPGFSYMSDSDSYYRMRDSIELLYGSSTLLFGGLGLIVGFLLEHKMRKEAASHE